MFAHGRALSKKISKLCDICEKHTKGPEPGNELHLCSDPSLLLVPWLLFRGFFFSNV